MEKIIDLIKGIWEVFKSRKGKKIINVIATILSIISYLIFIVLFKVGYGMILDYLTILLIPIIMLLIANVLNSSKRDARRNYLIVIIINLVFIGSLIYANTNGMKTGLYLNEIRYYNYNIVPFRTLKAILIDHVTYGLHDNLLLYNFFLFLGITIFLPLINKRFKNTYLFTLTVIGLGFLYEGIEYLLLIGCFDIDMIIVRTVGSLVCFLIIYKTKLISKIKEKLPRIKVNFKLLNLVYLGLFIILIMIISDNTFNYLNSKNYNKVSISGTFKCGNEETEVGIIDNYLYYSKCMGDYAIILDNERLTLEDFIRNTKDITKYMNKFKLRREKYITSVNVIENSLVGKKFIRKFDSRIEYYYNIESIKVNVDNETYNYEDYLKNFTPKDLDLNYTREKFYRDNIDGYSFYTGEYYNNLYCKDSMYYLPKTYKITKNTCSYLEKLK